MHTSGNENRKGVFKSFCRNYMRETFDISQSDIISFHGPGLASLPGRRLGPGSVSWLSVWMLFVL